MLKGQGGGVGWGGIFILGKEKINDNIYIIFDFIMKNKKIKYKLNQLEIYIFLNYLIFI